MAEHVLQNPAPLQAQRVTCRTWGRHMPTEVCEGGRAAAGPHSLAKEDLCPSPSKGASRTTHHIHVRRKDIDSHY